MDAKLRVLGGPCSGKTVRVPRGKLVIGRAEGCDLRLSSEFVSSHHCVLLLDDYTLRIRDLGSKNGTFVNGRRVGTSVTILLHDDTISVGELTALIDLTPPIPELEQAISDALTDASQTALQGTGIFDGDTLQADMPGVIPPSPASPLPAPIIPSELPPSDKIGISSREEPPNG
jgi:pSer/pThr/pTyr-binding forkhead associated (FHA) protein